MIGQVEDAIVARLKEQVTDLAAVLSYQGEDIETLLGELSHQLPAVVVIFAGGPWTRSSDDTFHRMAAFQLVLMVENHRSEQARRRGAGSDVGAYTLLEGIETALIGQDLGLEIDELTPTDTRNLYTEAGDGAGLSVWGLEVETGWEVCTAEEDAGDLTGLHADWTVDDHGETTAQDTLDL